MTTPPADRARFIWQNCYGDVIANRFDATIRSYWNKIASPALEAAENEVARWTNHEDESPRRATIAKRICSNRPGTIKSAAP